VIPSRLLPRQFESEKWLLVKQKTTEFDVSWNVSGQQPSKLKKQLDARSGFFLSMFRMRGVNYGDCFMQEFSREGLPIQSRLEEGAA